MSLQLLEHVDWFLSSYCKMWREQLVRSTAHLGVANMKIYIEDEDLLSEDG